MNVFGQIEVSICTNCIFITVEAVLIICISFKNWLCYSKINLRNDVKYLPGYLTGRNQNELLIYTLWDEVYRHSFLDDRGNHSLRNQGHREPSRHHEQRGSVLESMIVGVVTL